MDRAVKFAVSLPNKEFQELEKYRKKRGVSRSKLVLEAIQVWKEAKEKERLVRIYEEGYRKSPEKLPDLEGWEKASLNIFSHGDW
jgi:metal-responsive CopG/Arc/MetJ family transcriptional regulator